jgi:hypothetical protein
MRQEHLSTIIAAVGFVAALPAVAGTDQEFLREMARTDGNVLGDYCIPEEAARAAAETIDAAFLFELARTDGNAAANAAANAAQPAQDIVTAQK